MAILRRVILNGFKSIKTSEQSIVTCPLQALEYTSTRRHSSTKRAGTMTGSDDASTADSGGSFG